MGIEASGVFQIGSFRWARSVGHVQLDSGAPAQVMIHSDPKSANPGPQDPGSPSQGRPWPALWRQDSERHLHSFPTMTQSLHRATGQSDGGEWLLSYPREAGQRQTQNLRVPPAPQPLGSASRERGPANPEANPPWKPLVRRRPLGPRPVWLASNTSSDPSACARHAAQANHETVPPPCIRIRRDPGARPSKPTALNRRPTRGRGSWGRPSGENKRATSGGAAREVLRWRQNLRDLRSRRVLGRAVPRLRCYLQAGDPARGTKQ